MMSKTLYIIIGPTASGKTSFAIELAQRLGTEIISADSRQIFKEMNIGVARPSSEELQAVEHHLIATWSITEDYNVKRYETEAITIINSLFAKYDNLVLCGGSTLYVNSIINGIDDMPNTPNTLRSQLQSELRTKGLASLLEELEKKDKKYYEFVDKQNHRRVLRALEVIRITGKPFSDFRTSPKNERNFNVKIIGLERDRKGLIDRIDKRVDIMIANGLIDEVRGLISFKTLPALSTVGYRELFDYFDGKYSLDDAIELIKIHTRQYAKRQMTYFRKIDNIEWKKL